MLQSFFTWLADGSEPLQERFDLDPDADYPDIDEQLYRRQRELAAARPGVTIKEALGVPAVFRAVTMLSSLAASLELKEYVNDREVDPAPVVQRPCREQGWQSGDFIRDSVMYAATRGEIIWLVLQRAAGYATNILPVAPETMKSDWDGRSHRWYSLGRDGKRRDYSPEDVRHITPFVRDPETGRGLGPMQLAKVALNVAVEADVWASRFFVGNIPSLYLDSKVPLQGNDPDVIKQKWLTDPPNVPKVGYGLTPTVLDINPETAQLSSSRMMSRGDAALLFGIPGRMLEYSESGSSISYANVGDLATELVRLTLAPVYLEPMEQAFTDLRPRGHETRFDVEGLERADVKTRYDIHEKAIANQIYSPAYAARKENIEGGAPETVPVVVPQRAEEAS